MGQINCQQCIPNLYDINSSIQKNQPPLSIPTNQMHRINILSKNRNSHQIFTKKYSTQITRQDTQQLSCQNKSVFKQKASVVVVLTNNNDERQFRIEVQKGKKVKIGTSMSCHFHIPTNSNFKVSLQNIDNSIYINDLAVGSGAFIKSPVCVFQRSQQKNNQPQLFVIENQLLQFFLKESTKIPNQIQIMMKSINQRHQQQLFTFNHIEILLRKQNKKTFYVNQFICINFELTINSQLNNYQIIFNHQNSWKYINKKTLLKQNHILLLGCQQFHVKKIITPTSSSSLDYFNNYYESDIKIVDLQ